LCQAEAWGAPDSEHGLPGPQLRREHGMAVARGQVRVDLGLARDGVGGPDLARCHRLGVGLDAPETLRPQVHDAVADWVDEQYYARSPRTDPEGPEQGQYRVSRGGSTGDDAGSPDLLAG
jgi:hypothetical protein